MFRKPIYTPNWYGSADGVSTARTWPPSRSADDDYHGDMQFDPKSYGADVARILALDGRRKQRKNLLAADEMEREP